MCVLTKLKSSTGIIMNTGLPADLCFVSHVCGIEFKSVLRSSVLFLQEVIVLQNRIPSIKFKLRSVFKERQVNSSQ